MPPRSALADGTAVKPRGEGSSVKLRGTKQKVLGLKFSLFYGKMYDVFFIFKEGF